VSLKSVTAAEVAADPARFDTVIDVRAPLEFAEDHLPGALNWPVLDDEQRRVVGTLYKQTSPLEARKLGGAMVARNIADHLDRWVRDKPREWQPLVYCWRGGQRSGSLAWFLDQVGFRTARLEGGYKAFRAIVRDQLQALPARFDFRVLAGRTGSGKTRLLHALAAVGAQVLDLEGLARHRGSVLGGLPHEPQPAQKRFDTELWQALQALDPARPVFVESESRKIGALQLPTALIDRMHAQGTCLLVDMPDEARVELLLQEYGFFADQPERFCSLLDGLLELCGRDRVKHWQATARAGDWAGVFGDLMRDHYDPMYLRSIRRHYAGFDQARRIALADGSDASLQAAAQQLLESDAVTP
jgi:tRNA 2-selenouridine synthase